MKSTENRLAVALILAAVWIISLQCAEADSVLFSQTATAPGGYASQKGPNIDYLAADNFTLHTGAYITGVQWQGAFSSQPPSQITQFVVSFWSNNNGLPGSILTTYTIVGNAGQTLVGSSNGFLEYDYSIVLSNPFTAHNGVTYWISVQPTTNFPAQPQWYWRADEGVGTGFSAHSGSGGLTFQKGAGDLAFTLIGTTFQEAPPPPVPEPSTLLLVGSGLITLFQYRHRLR